VSQVDFLAQRWLKTVFLRDRNLAAPDSRPLHAYRCTDAELGELSNQLAVAAVGQGSVERHVAAQFCLFAAEWWRRSYDGSAWGWEPVFQVLGACYDWQQASQLTNKGLGFWQRSLRRSANGREFLLSLVLEGGLPLGLLSAGRGRLTDHLRRVLAELDRFGPNAELGRQLSEQHAHVLPTSFRRPEVHTLIGDLLSAVLHQRDAIPPTIPPSEAMAWLDAHAPNWRDELPLVVEDDAARELLAGLIRETVSLRDRGRPLVALVERILVNDGSEWCPMLDFTMDGIVALESLSPQAGTALVDAERARLHAAGDLESAVVAPLALMHIERGERREWRIEPLSGAAVPVLWGLDASVELNIRVNGATVCTFRAPGGEPALQPPLVFDAIEEGDQPTRLRLIGTGSIRTRKERLFVACRDATDLIPNDDGVAMRSLGTISGTDLTLHEIRGTVRWRGSDGGLALVLRTGSEDETRSRLTVDGNGPRWDVAAPIAVLGRPCLREVAGSQPARPVAITDLRWRPTSGGEWRSLPRDGSWPFGLIELALVRKGELLDRLRLAVLPETARVRVEAQGPCGGHVLLDGFGDAELHIDRHELSRDVVYGIETRADGALIRLDASGEPPSRVAVVVSWPGQGELCNLLPFPVRGGGFIDARGRWLRPRARLSLDQLYGVHALAGGGNGDAEIFGWLKAPDVAGDRQLWIRHRFNGSCSLTSLRSALLNLLAASQDLDAVVQLIVLSGGLESRPLAICRADLVLSVRDELISIDSRSLDALEDGERSQIELVCRPIADLGESEEFLPLVPDSGDAQSWVFVKAGRSPGAWLIYGRVAGRHRFRPRAVTVTAEEASIDSGTLAGICCIADHAARQQSLHRLLDAMTEDSQHGSWREVEQALLAMQGRLPLTTLDVLRSLPSRPDAMTVFLARAGVQVVGPILAMEDELPFLWTVMPLRAWMRAFTAAERSLADLLAGSGQTGEAARTLAGQVLDGTLARIQEEQPALAGTMGFVRERLGRPRPNDCTLAGLRHQVFRQVLAAQLGSLRMELRRRNDGATWPDWPDFRGRVEGLPPEHVDLPRYCRAVFDAPFAAARLAVTGAGADGQTMRALRLCRAFDPIWFDGAYVFALGLAASEPDKTSCWSA
jgi:hypothetical protein